MVWKPMSSAPVDGRRFLAGLWVGQGSAARFEMHIVRAAAGMDRIHPDDDRGWAWNDYTHCLELPPPSGGGAQDTPDQDTPDHARTAATPMHRAYGIV